MRRLSILCCALVIATTGVCFSTKASDAATETKQTFLDRGIGEKAKRDFGAAIADFGRAIALDPKWAVAYEFRGSVYAAKAEATDDPAALEMLTDKAVADYDTVIRLGNATPRTYTLRGIALADNGNFKAALADFDHALAIDGGFELATRMRNFATDQLQEQNHAIAVDSDLLHFQPRNVDLLLSRAVLLSHAGRRDEARQDIAKVLAIDPKNETALAERDLLQAGDTGRHGAKP